MPFLPLFLRGSSPLPAGPMASGPWLAIAYIVLVPTVLGDLLNLFALTRLRASTTAAYVYAQWLVTGFVGVLFLREFLDARIGFTLPSLFLGVWLVSRRPQKINPQS